MTLAIDADGVAAFVTALRSGSPQALALVERVLLIISSVVSFLGCAFVFTTWKSFAVPNYLSRRIVASMGLAGLATAFGFALSIFVDGTGDNYRHAETVCYTQAFVLQYFYLASYLWTACFAFHLYQIIVVRNEYPERLLSRYRLVGWGLPGVVLAFLILRQLTGHLGVGGADRRWCWIAVHNKQDAAFQWHRSGAWQQFFLFYFPIVVIFVFNSVIYHVILRFLTGDPMQLRLRRRVALYLVIFFLCSVWGVLNRLVQFVRADHSANTFLTVMECICDPLQPLLNAVAYGTNKSSLDAYKERFCTSWFYASLPSSDDDESGLDSTSFLSNDGDNEDDDRAFYYQDLSVESTSTGRIDQYPRRLTFPPPDEEDNVEDQDRTAASTALRR